MVIEGGDDAYTKVEELVLVATWVTLRIAPLGSSNTVVPYVRFGNLRDDIVVVGKNMQTEVLYAMNPAPGTFP
jgi:hypothetical protein